MHVHKPAEIPLPPEAQAIGETYARAAARLVRVVGALDPASYSEIKAAQTTRQVHEIVDGLNLSASQWSKRAVRAAYEVNLEIQGRRLSVLGARRNPGFNQGMHDQKIENRAGLAFGDLFKANSTIMATANKLIVLAGYSSRSLAKIQAQLDEEDIIDLIAEEAIGRGETRTQLAQALRDYLMGLMDGEKFIEINGRNYDISKYAELVASVRMREAQTDATKAACEEWDNDLVQVSSHANPCLEICAALDGQVFSLTGATPGYPLLIEEPPFHCRCGHSISATSIEAIQWNEEHAA